jgi:Rieske Fe-S protein
MSSPFEPGDDHELATPADAAENLAIDVPRRDRPRQLDTCGVLHMTHALIVLAGSACVVGLAAAIRGRRTRDAAPPDPPPAEGGERFPRNRLLERATVGLGGLVALGITLPAVGFAALPGFLRHRRRPIDLGPTASFPVGEFVVATFLSDATAGEVSRRAAYVRNNGSLGSLPSFTIMSSRCTHVGCPTQPNGPIFGARRRAAHTSSGEVGLVPAQPGGFGCPCHGSQFDTEGNRTAGPAPRALDRYEFSIRNGHLLLGRLYSVSRVQGTGAEAQIHGSDFQGAGQPLTGPESWFYPLAPPS